MRTVVIIPARMGSSRFPGKPLARILDLPMIEHVRRRVCLCEDIDDVIVATCDEEILRAVEDHGGKAVMTSDKHERCTDRIAEAARPLAADVIVNVQGDEPCVFPQCVSDVARPVRERDDCPCSTLIYPVATYEELENPNYVKTVMSQSGSVLYFGRNVMPSRRKGESPKLYKQSGIMAYRRDFLLEFTAWPQTPLERVESCDMLRILENDRRIQGVVTPYETPGVDIPGDIETVERLIRTAAEQQRLYERILEMGN
ncbi:MAG: 3-deoxy-manno-octulosonate cytidylyltransferase [Planctomycetes bacterium]|nr:3-deoxy-manno-octulosonate cytidylyltransferase [Planctomycetota bacterium]